MSVRNGWVILFILIGVPFLLAYPNFLKADIPAPSISKCYLNVTIQIEYEDYISFSYANEVTKDNVNGVPYHEVGYNEKNEIYIEKHFDQEHNLYLIRFEKPVAPEEDTSHKKITFIDKRSKPIRIIEYEMNANGYPSIFRYLDSKGKMVKAREFHANGKLKRIALYNAEAKIPDNQPSQVETYDKSGLLVLIETFENINDQRCCTKEERYEANQLSEYTLYKYSKVGKILSSKTYNSKDQLVRKSE